MGEERGDGVMTLRRMERKAWKSCLSDAPKEAVEGKGTGCRCRVVQVDCARVSPQTPMSAVDGLVGRRSHHAPREQQAGGNG
jgi:hypothetical protein